MKKKMIAPIIIGIIAIIYYLFFFFILMEMPMLWLTKILFGVIPIAIIVAIIIVVISRIKEIKGGEEDDLSKY